MLRERGPQPFEVARTKRHRPAPRSAARGVCEANDPLALLRLQQLDDRRKTLLACALWQRQLSIVVAGPHGVALVFTLAATNDNVPCVL